MLNSDVTLTLSYNYSDYVKYEIRTKNLEETNLYINGLNYFSKLNKMRESKGDINKHNLRLH